MAGTVESGLTSTWHEGEQAACEIKQGKPHRPYPILDVVAEDCQSRHVADQVDLSAVAEEAGEQ